MLKGPDLLTYIWRRQNKDTLWESFMKLLIERDQELLHYDGIKTTRLILAFINPYPFHPFFKFKQKLHQVLRKRRP